MITLLGVPYDADSSYRRGPADAPAAIRAELARAGDYSNTTTESGLDLAGKGVWRDGGDVVCGAPEDTRRAIESAVAGLLANGERPLLMGGDHAITYPALRALHAVHGPLDVLHLDAHPDLYPEFAGNRYSHACTFARALEDGLIGRLVQVGIRTLNAPQRAVADRYGVEQIAMREWTRPPALFFDGPIYVSLDLDAIDPAFAPGVSHPEPGGLSVREVIGTLQRTHGTVVGADLVEYNPGADLDGRSAPVCVKLLKELVGRLGP
jgi:agmatinase